MPEWDATFNFIENSLDDSTSRLNARRENAARPAVAEMLYLSTGVGQQRINTPLIFPVIFRNSPHLSTGSAVVTNPDPLNWHDPIGHCGVYMWQRDPRGNYTGAWIWTRVDVYTTPSYIAPGPGLDVTPAMKVQFFLTFSGTAFKQLPTNGISQNMTPRTSGLDAQA